MCHRRHSKAECRSTGQVVDHVLTVGQPLPLCAFSLTNNEPRLQEKALHLHRCPSSVSHQAEVEGKTTDQK